MNILYLSHIDWFWIKQRPQFLAQELSKKHNVDIYYQPSYIKNNLQSHSDFTKVNKLPKVPLKNRFNILFKCNNYIQKKWINKIIKNKDYDAIYITHPEFYPLIKDIHNRIIYDCMDDYSGFFSINDIRYSRYKTYEFNLCNLDNIVILASSNALKEKLNKITDKDIKLIRNGLKDDFVFKLKHNESNIITKVKTSKKIITYIGTIAEWFDFSILKEKTDPNIEYHIYGPKDVNDDNFNDQIIYKGILEHEDIVNVAAKSDALIMPFVVNDLIKSVDPVKLYEYISFNKPIICCYYDEISRFCEFVNFYHNQMDFNKIIDDLLFNNIKPYSKENAIDFLLNSTWTSRGNDLNDFISSK